MKDKFLNKSHEFIVNRLKEIYDYPDKTFMRALKSTDICFEPFNVIPESFQELTRNNEITLNFSGENVAHERGETNITIKYNPYANFEYFTSHICSHDGTLVFLQEAIASIMNKLFNLETYNTETAPENLAEHVWEYNYEYTIGDFIVVDEFGPQFAPEDKPWMQQRQTVMLPIAIKYVKKEQ